jgi:hypothetical protein
MKTEIKNLELINTASVKKIQAICVILAFENNPATVQKRVNDILKEIEGIKPAEQLAVVSFDAGVDSLAAEFGHRIDSALPKRQTKQEFLNSTIEL